MTESEPEMLLLVDRKPFTRNGGCRMELNILCGHWLDEYPDVVEPQEPVPGIVDTGFEGSFAVAASIYEGHFNIGPVSALPEEKIPLVGGKTLTTKQGFCNVWVVPFGAEADLKEPLMLEVAGKLKQVAVIPTPSQSAGERPNSDNEEVSAAQDECLVGMYALQNIRARLDIDFEEEVFSIRVPLDVVSAF